MKSLKVNSLKELRIFWLTQKFGSDGPAVKEGVIPKEKTVHNPPQEMAEGVVVEFVAQVLPREGTVSLPGGVSSKNRG